MTTLTGAVPGKTARDLADEAVSHALAGRWEKAVEINRQSIEARPDDADARNRLAKALTELGRYQEARDSALLALAIRPGDVIATRHLDRIDQLTKSGARRGVIPSHAARPSSFISDRVASIVTELRSVAPAVVLATTLAGDRLNLVADGTKLLVKTDSGKALGALETHLAQHLRRLITGGNRYEVTAARVNHVSVAVVIREVSKSPRQAGLVSFPPTLRKYAEVRNETEADEMSPDSFETIQEVLDGDRDDEDNPQPQEVNSQRLKAILNRDSSEDDGIATDLSLEN